jgi:hypothetical protein
VNRRGETGAELFQTYREEFQIFDHSAEGVLSGLKRLHHGLHLLDEVGSGTSEDV